MQIIRNAAEAVFTDNRREQSQQIPPSLYLWLENSANTLSLHIKDNGPGIPPDIADSIFIAGVSSHDGQHRGHGLSSASGLAKFWGGSIAYHPSDTGAHFSISFPLGT